MTLYHWTCEHSVRGIENSHSWVLPMGGWSWWTDLGNPGKRTRAACGLTSHLLACDRMQYRCEVDPGDAGLLAPWPQFAAARGLSAAYVESLAAAPGAKPDRWWVSAGPVRCLRIVRAGVLTGRARR